jgi:hypothetical protein
MHESVVTLQNLIAEDRQTVRALADALDHAKQNDVTLINGARMTEQVRFLTKHCGNLEGLIDEYLAAQRDGRTAEAAYSLVLIQYAAATMVQQREAADGG